jgi:hypothetical protein
MDSFSGKLAVVTGGGSGMGRELVRQLAAQGCSVGVAVVMPGHIGTDIVANSMRARGLLPAGEQLTEDQRTMLAELIRRGLLPEGASADELRQVLEKMNSDFRTSAPLDAAGAATIILDGVRSGAWRILVGQDAEGLDGFVRAKPEAAYDYALLASMAANAADRTG